MSKELDKLCSQSSCGNKRERERVLKRFSLSYTTKKLSTEGNPDSVRLKPLYLRYPRGISEAEAQNRMGLASSD
jgi:hypothetical protein